MRNKTTPEVDPETYAKFIRCVTYLLARVMEKEFPPVAPAPSGSNVIKLKRRKT